MPGLCRQVSIVYQIQKSEVAGLGEPGALVWDTLGSIPNT